MEVKKTIQWYIENPDINNISTKILDPTPWKSSN